MAIYHFSAKVISRAAGRSAVAAAAYRSASELHDERAERAHDFTAKTGVVHSEVLLPEGAPERLSDRATLWNEVEATEKRKDAQLAREVEFALPREMTQAEGVRLAREFVQREFVDRGMVADLNVHCDRDAQGEAKPHAHVMLTLREVGPEGFGKKARVWNATEELRGWRERWAEHVNGRLAELGIDARVDHRSLREQGIDLEPQHKIGPAGARREEQGEEAERADEHRAIAARNGERIAAEPEIALRALTHQHSTFTRQDLARLIHRHSDGQEQFDRVMARVEASPEIVRLGEDGRGRERFTTREMIGVEERMERAADRMSESRGHRVGSSAQEAALRSHQLGDEQEAAFRHVTGRGDLALVVGFAGTGKSTMLGAGREAWEAQGYQVRGAALSGIAAENLEGGSGIASRTIASLEHAWGQGREGLTSRDVLVIDEAGMVGSRQMERVLSHAQAAGAKVVLVGDPEQLQAIEAGAAFRALAERHGAAEITSVRRQAEEWQRAATKELATGRTGEALSRYSAAGMVHEHGTREEAKAALVERWDGQRRAAPDQSSAILAYTRDDVRGLNELARAKLREAGELGADQMVTTERGERAFAPGDRVMFLRNERSLGVKNGTLGTLERIEGASSLTVRLDGPEGARVTFDLKDYAHLDHGYAATVHKAQGVTVDRAHVLATSHMDRHAAYVGLTRHREGVELHWAREDLRDRVGLDRALSRERAKDTTLDYQAGFAERRGIVPPSEIVVPRSAAEQEPTPERASPRRGRFAGLKLGAGATRHPDPREAGRGATREAGRALDHTRVAQAIDGYARAFADAQRMRDAGLPVLPHQELGLARASERLEQASTALAGDLRRALERQPELAAGIATREGRAALMQAVAQERKVRLDPSLRAERYVEAWTKLEEERGTLASWGVEGEQRQVVESRMRELAGAIKRDPEAESTMRTRRQELGIAAGSRLARVLEASSEREALQQTRSQGLSLGR
ncbi:Ti-type conjugative transfer relaxase TraA [Methylobacterium isbiliense]|uniref:ATP-dependent RecD-like DNA helicase n=1 Tax=Methylobacterium isbiliense TaxID=315478 RepID=A0ABQ4SJT4_9HYPH|nr:Ti-type conjugative transfer relaxase TraA [Methylobacterium isbiliense]MDN3627385.1 Ti-type conjugative transfer relaxase TraA [Methylobacterium isbiliense]GJE02034.1 ATP-dependent RecD-like DNA helicase [Methylobacterium isbiliense]